MLDSYVNICTNVYGYHDHSILVLVLYTYDVVYFRFRTDPLNRMLSK